jgi:hypothetical protein
LSSAVTLDVDAAKHARLVEVAEHRVAAPGRRATGVDEGEPVSVGDHQQAAVVRELHPGWIAGQADDAFDGRFAAVTMEYGDTGVRTSDVRERDEDPAAVRARQRLERIARHLEHRDRVTGRCVAVRDGRRFALGRG